MTAEASAGRADDRLHVDATGRADISNVRFDTSSGRHVASLELVILYGDASEAVVGEWRARVDLNLSTESHTAALDDGLAWSSRVPVDARPRFVKVIVYDQAADLVGSTTLRLR